MKAPSVALHLKEMYEKYKLGGLPGLWRHWADTERAKAEDLVRDPLYGDA